GAVVDLLDALLIGVEGDAAPIDDRVVAVERDARRAADVEAVSGPQLHFVFARLVAARAREAEVEARAFEDLAAAVREIDVEALDRRRLVLERLAVEDGLAMPIDERALVDHLFREEELERHVRRRRRARELDRDEHMPRPGYLVHARALQ